jgi:homocitrate synthase NifV
MILDTTLREGVQRVGVYLDLSARRKVVFSLLGAGVAELEIGVVGRDGHLRPLLDSVATERPEALCWVWARMRTEDVELAARMDIRNVSLCAPASIRHQELRLGLSAEAARASVHEVVARAASLGLMVSVGLEDASRARPEELVATAEVAREAGAVRVRLADTVGLLSAAEVSSLVSRLSATGLEVGFHGHNDFGMATANALAALDAGAVAVDASLLGCGERAGVAATEVLGTWLALRRSAPFSPPLLAAAARGFSDLSGQAIAPHAPVVGERLFACETGLHVAAIARDPSLYEPFNPSLVGSHRELCVGGKSGLAAIRQALQEDDPGIEVTSDLVSRVRRAAERLGRPLQPGELSRLARAA